MPDLRPPVPDFGAPFRLDGKTAVVTGGGSGIGRGAAHALSQAGANIDLLDVDTDLVAETATEVGGVGIAIDVTDEEAVVDVFAGLDRCDVLVTCAGRSLRAPSMETSMTDWQAVVDLNLTATFLCSREAARRAWAHGHRGRCSGCGPVPGNTGRGHGHGCEPSCRWRLAGSFKRWRKSTR